MQNSNDSLFGFALAVVACGAVTVSHHGSVRCRRYHHSIER